MPYLFIYRFREIIIYRVCQYCRYYMKANEIVALFVSGVGVIGLAVIDSKRQKTKMRTP